MPAEPPEIRKLRELPRSERREALESLIVAEFLAVAMMEGEEELPTSTSFFELGFTSLRLTEVKQRLEIALGCEISANELFNRPTIDALVEYLAENALAVHFTAPAPAAAAAPSPEDRLVDELLDDLYTSSPE
ncbi:hypothetical protein GCM10027589_08510 [Actinocorallia lasiicapitis]